MHDVVMEHERRLTSDLLLRAYRKGLFPMVHEDGELLWHDPDPRAILPLGSAQPNARARSFFRTHGYQCTIDRSFRAVITACADRESTWIGPEFVDAYHALHLAGFAHSAETWKEGKLIGGIYGVSIGAAFFGESMFSHASNASKAALYHLTDVLRDRGGLLFDVQYINAHTRSLGAVEIPRDAFRAMLRKAIRRPDPFAAPEAAPAQARISKSV